MCGWKQGGRSIGDERGKGGGEGANIVDPLHPNMGIHILHTVSCQIHFVQC